jgi:hypothetical protein
VGKPIISDEAILADDDDLFRRTLEAIRGT